MSIIDSPTSVPGYQIPVPVLGTRDLEGPVIEIFSWKNVLWFDRTFLSTGARCSLLLVFLPGRLYRYTGTGTPGTQASAFSPKTAFQDLTNIESLFALGFSDPAETNPPSTTIPVTTTAIVYILHAYLNQHANHHVVTAKQKETKGRKRKRHWLIHKFRRRH